MVSVDNASYGFIGICSTVTLRSCLPIILLKLRISESPRIRSQFFNIILDFSLIFFIFLFLGLLVFDDSRLSLKIPIIPRFLLRHHCLLSWLSSLRIFLIKWDIPIIKCDFLILLTYTLSSLLVLFIEMPIWTLIRVRMLPIIIRLDIILLISPSKSSPNSTWIIS